jgi:hypothetical protein
MKTDTGLGERGAVMRRESLSSCGCEGRTPWLLFALLLLCYAYFFPRWADWGQNSKLDLTLAIVDKGTLMIDDYVHNTGDYAYYNGHYYSDKAPGTSFLGVLPYAAFKLAAQTPLMTRLMDAIRANPALAATLRPEGSGLLEDKVYQALALTVITFSIVAVPSALLGVVLYRLAGMFTPNRTYALLVPVIYGLATIAFPYSSILNSRQIVAVLLTVSFYLLLRLGQRGRGMVTLALVGFLLGLALICDYPSALIIAGIGLYGAYAARRALGVHPVRAALIMAAAALPPVLLMAAYNFAIFGTPLPVGYLYSVLYTDLHAQGLVSLTYPKLDALHGLTFGSFRGLFYLSPVLLLALAGFWACYRTGRYRAELLVSLWAVASFLLFNSSSAMWWGGFAVGPAYLVPMLPFLALGLVFFLQRWGGRGWARALVAGLAVLSFVLVWAETIGGQSFPDLTPNPLIAYSLPRLAAGDIARNFGMLLRLRGFASLLPLALGMALCAYGLWRFVVGGRRRTAGGTLPSAVARPASSLEAGS